MGCNPLVVVGQKQFKWGSLHGSRTGKSKGWLLLLQPENAARLPLVPYLVTRAVESPLRWVKIARIEMEYKEFSEKARSTRILFATSYLYKSVLSTRAAIKNKYPSKIKCGTRNERGCFKNET